MDETWLGLRLEWRNWLPPPQRNYGGGSCGVCNKGFANKDGGGVTTTPLAILETSDKDLLAVDDPLISDMMLGWWDKERGAPKDANSESTRPKWSFNEWL